MSRDDSGKRSLYRRAPALALILALAALVRLAHLFAASTLPSFTHHRLDALLYHRAGQALAAGDLSLGGGVLHMSPLYSYFVGAVYALFGDGPWPLRLIQLALGVGTVALTYLCASRLLSRRFAAIAGVAAALYGPLVFYEANLSVAGIAAFLTAALMLAALRVAGVGADAAPRREDPAGAGGEGGRGALLLLGVLWGLAALARPTALLLAVPIAAALWFRFRRAGWRRRAIAAALVGAGLAVTVAPVTARNWIVGGEPVLVTDSGGLNFYLGNGDGAIGTFRVPPELPGATNARAQFRAFSRYAEKEAGRPLSSREVDRFWYRRTLTDIAADPARWARLLLEKAWLFWNRRELPNNFDYGFAREINPVLRIAAVQMGLVAPFALVGLLAVFARRRPGEILIALFALTQCAALIVFFVLAHYRVPAVPALILLATFGLAALREAAADRRPRLAALYLAALALSVPIVFAPKLPKPYDDEYFKLGYAYQIQNDLPAAESAYLRALAINGDNLSAHKNLAVLYTETGRLARARFHWTRALDLARQRGDARSLEQARRALETLPSD